MPKIATCRLKSNSPYSQSRQYFVEFLTKESHDEFEKRTWRERSHYHGSGQHEGRLYIPGIQFKNSLIGAANMRGEKIKGKGAATYLKHFKAGIRVIETINLPVKKDNVPGIWLSMDAQGKKGGGRVLRCFPIVQEWKGEVKFLIVDSTITPDVFERHLREAGCLVGIGRWSPRVGGENGCYMLDEDAKEKGKVVPAIQWSEM